MPRRPTYDMDQVLRGSAMLFKQQGFHQVSVNDLLKATGLNRFALYEKFGGKEGLFYDTMDFYHEVMVRGELLGPLYKPSARLGSVVKMLRVMRRINRNPDTRPGCLIMNANIELGGEDDRVAEGVEFVIRTFREATRKALENAAERSELDGSETPEVLSERLALMIQAFFSLAYISRDAADRLLLQMIGEVESWRA
jgi:TetR/AcrR family transcriptional regulator, transcriptional repressor for nem operon